MPPKVNEAITALDAIVRKYYDAGGSIRYKDGNIVITFLDKKAASLFGGNFRECFNQYPFRYVQGEPKPKPCYGDVVHWHSDVILAADSHIVTHNRQRINTLEQVSSTMPIQPGWVEPKPATLPADGQVKGGVAEERKLVQKRFEGF